MTPVRTNHRQLTVHQSIQSPILTKHEIHLLLLLPLSTLTLLLRIVKLQLLDHSLQHLLIETLHAEYQQ